MKDGDDGLFDIREILDSLDFHPYHYLLLSIYTLH